MREDRQETIRHYQLQLDALDEQYRQDKKRYQVREEELNTKRHEMMRLLDSKHQQYLSYLRKQEIDQPEGWAKFQKDLLYIQELINHGYQRHINQLTDEREVLKAEYNKQKNKLEEELVQFKQKETTC